MSLLLFLLIYTLQLTSVKANYANFSSAHYYSSLLENQPLGTPVLQLQLQIQNNSFQDFFSLSLTGPLHSHFILDTNTIYTASVLDRESTPLYELTALALCNNTVVDTANVTISIGDINDNRPLCLHTFYAISVDENSITNEALVLQCWDLDAGNNATLNYQLQNDYSAFSINETGVLSLSQTLDYEQTPDGFLLEVVISDLGEPPLSTLVSVLVTILPINEFPPRFTTSPLTSSISENTKPENRIAEFTASDMDSGRDGDIYYFLTSTEEEGLFHVDLYSGSLYLLRSLDRERKSVYSLQITASNSPIQGTPGDLNSSVAFKLTLLDIPDDLHFEKRVYFATVPESINSQDIERVSCRTSSSPNPAFTYSISSDTFIIDPSSGLITASLDYENGSSYELTISCSCCTSPSLTSYTTLFISVSDTNEFPPLFSSPSYSVSVEEEAQLGTELLQVTSVDRDTGNYGTNVFYSLLDHTQLFYLHPNTGTLYLRGSLDYRTNSSYNLTLLSANTYPASPSPLTDTATVHVTVTESLTNRPPDCPQQLVVVKIEETSPVQLPLAQFSCASNSSLNFSFHNYDPILPFSLSDQGSLSLHSPLDYESGITQYFLEIRVRRDQSPLFTPIFSQVIVTPVNEYTPLFTQPLYSLTLSELTLVGTSLLNVSATDADAMPDGGVAYHLSAENNTFSIDPLSGSVYLISSLNYDIASQYNVSITAFDLSSHPLTSTATLQIQIINENTLPPICYPRYLPIFINESAPLHSVVAAYSCYDPDAILLSSELTLSLSSPIHQFLTPINGSLVLTTKLDYETATEYTGVLIVSEPNSTFSTQIAISIFVEPSNEFYPHFINLPYALRIDSQTLLSSLIHTVRAVDGDSGRDGELFYFLNMTKSASIFYIDSRTGDIWLRYPVHHVSYTAIEVSVGVKDQSLTRQLENYGTLSVSILHETNYTCDQYFYSILTPENTGVNSTLFNISCVSAVDYMLEDADLFYATFSVTSEGQIITSRPLDAETTDLYESTLTVVFPYNATLTIGISVSLQDNNEFSPSFTSPSHYQLYSDTELGALLFTFLAVDSDIFYNKVSYSLVDTIPGLYLSRHTGELFLSSKLVFSLPSPLNIFVMAHDNDPVHSLSTTTQLRIDLINTSSPEPENLQLYPLNPVFIFRVRENQETGSLVGNVSCNGMVHEIQYRVRSGNLNLTFSLDMQSGQLVLDKSLDYEEVSSYALMQSCSSSVNANVSNEFLTIVEVLDVNEYPPLVENPDITVHLYENYTVGEKIYSLEVEDPDDPSTPIIYRITHTEPETSPFTIAEHSGDIYLVDKLDYEQQSYYSVYIDVYDGDPSEISTRSSQVRITVRVMDINDNAPLCSPVLTLHTTSKSNRSRELVGRLNCSDMDSQEMTSLRYYEEITISQDYFVLIREGDPTTWLLYFLAEEARASHNGSLFNAYFHNVVCCDGSAMFELCTDFLVLVTTVQKSVQQPGLNAAQLALAVKSEGLENLIMIFFNISRHYWDEVVDHFKLITANIITTYCISHPFECSIADCSSNSQTEWFGTDNVMIQDVFTVSTDNGAQLEVQFYVSLPDIPLNSNATTNYVVPGGVLLELLRNRMDLLPSPSPLSLQCTNSLNQLLPYLLVTFVLGVLFALALSILAFITCKLYKCWNEKAHIIVSRKKIHPDEGERLRISSIADEMELRSMPEDPMGQKEAGDILYSDDTITPLSSLSRDRDDVLSDKIMRNSVELEKSGRKEAQKPKKHKSVLDESENSMNPFWKTNPRFWKIQDKEIETEFCISPHLSVPEPNPSMKDSDSHITEYYSSTDLSAFTSQTGLSQASMKAMGKARGRYDMMELASMASEALPNNKIEVRSGPESNNLSSQSASRSTTLYLPSSSSTASNTSIQELPKSSTPVIITTQDPGVVNLVPKNAW